MQNIERQVEVVELVGVVVEQLLLDSQDLRVEKPRGALSFY